MPGATTPAPQLYVADGDAIFVAINPDGAVLGISAAIVPEWALNAPWSGPQSWLHANGVIGRPSAMVLDVADHVGLGAVDCSQWACCRDDEQVFHSRGPVEGECF